MAENQDLELERARQNMGVEETQESEEETETTTEDSEEETKSEEDEEETKGKSAAKETDSEESEEDDTDEEEDEEASRKQNRRTRTVPYDLLKTERGKSKVLKDTISDLQKKLAEARSEDSGRTTEEELDDIEEEAKALGEDLKADPNALSKVLRAAVSLAKKELGKQAIPKEIQDKLALLDKYEKDQQAQTELNHFTNEWNGLVDSLKKTYPNATEAQLAEARKEMDKLAHSKEYAYVEGEHEAYPLDYVLFREKKVFDTLLKVSKGKSGENSKHIVVAESDDEEVDDIDLDPENMTPERMNAYDNMSLKQNSKSDKRDYRILRPVR